MMRHFAGCLIVFRFSVCHGCGEFSMTSFTSRYTSFCSMPPLAFSFERFFEHFFFERFFFELRSPSPVAFRFPRIELGDPGMVAVPFAVSSAVGLGGGGPGFSWMEIICSHSPGRLPSLCLHVY